ncbi:RDD family protein [Hyunsoonleella rubra]|uniref:RDD family protein n=1 Tax=Hyunsoonleella rubra TaxID=1737062 RepID=A0ABW5T752_9FLAO
MQEDNFLVTPDLYAGKEKRFINLIVDTIGYYIFSFIVGLFLGVLELIGLSGALDFIANMGVLGSLVFGVVVVTIYFCGFEVPTQRTLGKFITKTMVVMEDGTKPTFQDILIRSLCRFIPFEAFSFLGSEGRGWHDSMSNTYVVDIEKFKAKKESQNELDQIGVPQDID